MDMILNFVISVLALYVFLCTIFTTMVFYTIISNFKEIKHDIKNEFDDINDDSVNETIKFVRIETHGSIKYMYCAVTDRFICWAESEDELWQTAQNLFPNLKLLPHEEVVMNGDDEIKITFAPGCFDQFDGTQEELDEFLAILKEMVESGELLENSKEIDIDDLDDNERNQIERMISGIDKKLH